MKPFDTLTEQELVALDEDAIQQYIDYACAEDGVPLLPLLPPAPKPVDVTPDAKYYSVGHALHFRTAEEAVRVLETIKANNPIDTGYISTPGSVTSTTIGTGKPYLTISESDAFSAGMAASIKDALAAAKREEEAYTKAKKAYDAAVAQRQSYADEIRGKVSDAWETHDRREEIRRAYERYLSLAGGQADVAARFLSNAYRDAEELLPDLFPPLVLDGEMAV